MSSPSLEKTRELVAQAVTALQGVCDGAHTTDGQGFNGWDAKFVRDVTLRPVASWSPKVVAALHKTLGKYRGQLSNMGIDYQAIPPVNPMDIAAQATRADVPVAEKKVRIDRIGDKVAIRFPFIPEFVAEVKKISGREWDSARKLWLVPMNQTGLEDLTKFMEFAKKNLPVEEQTGISEEMEKIQRENAEMQNASIAASADFYVEGLGGELRPFQRAGVAYASKAKRCFIADEMGLGKTVQALATIHHLQAYPALIVCPASLKINWMREANKWLPGRHNQVLPSWFKADLDITNYEALPKLKQQLIEKKYKAIVFDECHYLKNAKAIRTKNAQEIASGIEVRLGLSGTPLVNRPAELLAQLGVLGRLDDVGGFKRFAQRYLRWDFKGFGTNLDELQREMRAKCFIRRKKSDVLTELPPKVRQFVEMPLASRQAYDSAADGAEHAIAAIQLFRHEAARQKLPAVKEWVQEFLDTGEKLVLFAVHIDIQEELVKSFPGCAKILGEDPVIKRQAAVDRFQTDPECRLVVCSLKAAGVGLTLTAASNVAFVEQGWTPGDMDQAEDRCHRIGQRDSVTAFYLVASNTVDSEISELIVKKRDAISQATDADKAKVEPSVMGDLIKKYARKLGLPEGKSEA